MIDRSAERTRLLAELDVNDEDLDHCGALRTRLAALETAAPLALALRAPNLAVLLYGYPVEANQLRAREELVALPPDLIGEGLQCLDDTFADAAQGV